MNMPESLDYPDTLSSLVAAYLMQQGFMFERQSDKGSLYSMEIEDHEINSLHCIVTLEGGGCCLRMLVRMDEGMYLYQEATPQTTEQAEQVIDQFLYIQRMSSFILRSLLTSIPWQ